jgi:hypothetical protein
MMLSVSLIMWGDNLVPNIVTEIVGLPPDNIATKGEAKAQSSGKGNFARTGMWSISTDGFVTTDVINDHLKFIVDKCSAPLRKLREEKMVEKSRISVIVSMDGEEAAPSWEDEVNANILAEFAQIDTSLSLAVLCPAP